MREQMVENGGIMPRCMAFLNNTHPCNRMAESSSAETSLVPRPFAETSTSSNFSGSSHSTNFSAYTSEVESDSQANSSEAGPS